MVNLSSIPDNTKWRIAAEFSATLPALYDQTFRDSVGERYDRIEQEVWMKAAPFIFDIARSLSLPADSAKELADTIHTIMGILFGPEFKSETLELSKDGAVIIIRRCPLIAAGFRAGSDGDRTFGRCMAFTLIGVSRLNSNFSARFVRTLCSGDRQCEIRVARSARTVPDIKPKEQP